MSKHGKRKDAESDRHMQAFVAMIADKSIHEDSFDMMDRLIYVSTQTDVWVYLEASIESAAKQHGWLAVKNHVENSGMSDDLKSRALAKISAGVSDELVADEEIKSVESTTRTELAIRAMRLLIADSSSPTESFKIFDKILADSKQSGTDVWKYLQRYVRTAASSVGWLEVRKRLRESGISPSMDPRMFANVNAGVFEDDAKRSVDPKLAYIEGLVVGVLTFDTLTKTKALFCLRNVVLNDMDLVLVYAKLSEPGSIMALRETLAGLMKMTDDDIIDLMCADKNTIKFAKKKAADKKFLDDEINKVEDTMVESIKDPVMKARVRTVVRKMFTQDVDLRSLLAKMSNPETVCAMRDEVVALAFLPDKQLDLLLGCAVKEAEEFDSKQYGPKRMDWDKERHLDRDSMRAAVRELKAEKSLDEKVKDIEDLTTKNVTDLVLKAKTRPLVRDLFYNLGIQGVDITKIMHRMMANPESIDEMRDRMLQGAGEEVVGIDSDETDRVLRAADDSYGPKRADLKSPEEKIEDLIVENITDAVMKAKTRLLVGKFVRKLSSSNVDLAHLLSKISDPEALSQLRMQVYMMASMPDDEINDELKDVEEYNLEGAMQFHALTGCVHTTMEEKTKMVEDLFIDETVDAVMEERVRYVVRTVICRNFDPVKLMSNLYDPKVVAKLRETVKQMVILPDKQIDVEVQKMASEMARDSGKTNEVQPLGKALDVDLKRKALETVEKTRSEINDNVVSSDLHAHAAKELEEKACKAMQRRHEVEMIAAAHRAADNLRLREMEKEAEAKANAKAAAKAKRIADALLRDEAEARAAAEARARRAADALKRQEADSKAAAERRVEKAKRAAEVKEQQKLEEKIRQERLAKEREDAKAVRAARQAEARRAAEEEEARLAIEQVEARCATDARRAAKKAEKRRARLAVEARLAEEAGLADQVRERHIYLYSRCSNICFN
jgi:hypothetical protein